MGIPKEGSSAGITLVTGIVSALMKSPIRNDVAMTGEITIMGKCCPWVVSSKSQSCLCAGVKEVILPADNIKEAKGLPSYILESIKLTSVTTIEEVLQTALVTNQTVTP
jgi:ATP-dependent Lon protease